MIALLDPFAWWRRRRRRRLLATEMPAAWQEWFHGLPLYQRLSPAEQDALRDRARILIAEKNWEGCGGLSVTDEMRVTIAAQAALLILAIDDEFPALQSILIYPSAFVNPMSRADADGVESAGTALHGEAWKRGPVILDWDETTTGVASGSDGRNLVLHEFAHKLDLLDGFADGCPPLRSRPAYLQWHRVMSQGFAALQRDSDRGRATVLDRYGATNPAEFFAVATESFFEESRQLRARHPEMYAALASYYRQDPAERE